MAWRHRVCFISISISQQIASSKLWNPLGLFIAISHLTHGKGILADLLYDIIFPRPTTLDLTLGLSWPQGHRETPCPGRTQGSPGLPRAQDPLSAPWDCPDVVRAHLPPALSWVAPLSWDRDAPHTYYLSLKWERCLQGFHYLLGSQPWTFWLLLCTVHRNFVCFTNVTGYVFKALSVPCLFTSHS